MPLPALRVQWEDVARLHTSVRFGAGIEIPSLSLWRLGQWVCNEDTLMVWGIFRGERNGTTFETHHAYYYLFEDGQIVKGHTIPADQTAANAFWSS